jgi:hypothetical protein
LNICDFIGESFALYTYIREFFLFTVHICVQALLRKLLCFFLLQFGNENVSHTQKIKKHSFFFILSLCIKLYTLSVCKRMKKKEKSSFNVFASVPSLECRTVSGFKNYQYSFSLSLSFVFMNLQMKK